MPIRESERGRYPADWRAISLRIRGERAGWRCECTGHCGDDHGGRCGALGGKPHPITNSIVVLTVAHLNHTPEDCRDENLLAACQRCHLRYDAAMKARGRRERARAASGQLDLEGTTR